MKFYIIGDRELVLAFKLTGVEGKVAYTREEVLEAFYRVTGQKTEITTPCEELLRVLILTEAAASLIENEEIEWQKTGQYPLIVEIPGLEGRLHNKKTLTESIREAIGVQI